MEQEFEWDDEKAKRNQANHGVPFDEASTVFGDLLSATIPDPLHSAEENRFVTVGMSYRQRVIVVVHSERGERTRIISARQATSSERKKYEEG